MAGRDLGRLRIGLALTPPLEGATLELVPEIAARDAAALLESLGHYVEEIMPPWSGLNLLSLFTGAFGPQIAMTTFIGGGPAAPPPTPPPAPTPAPARGRGGVGGGAAPRLPPPPASRAGGRPLARRRAPCRPPLPPPRP